jgi:hypothetical protein
MDVNVGPFLECCKTCKKFLYLHEPELIFPRPINIIDCSFIMSTTDIPMAESDSIWLYNPNFAVSIAFTLIYLIPTTIQFYQSILKYRAYYFSVVLVGAVLEVAGYAVRAAACKQQMSIVGDVLFSVPHVSIIDRHIF